MLKYINDARSHECKTPDTYCKGGWVIPRAGLNGYGKSRPPPGLDPRIVQRVASCHTDQAILRGIAMKT